MSKTIDLKKIISIILKVLAVALGFVFFWRILCTDAFGKNIYSMQAVASNETTKIILALIRMLANGGVIIAILSPFFSLPSLKRAARYFLLIVLITNIIFSGDIIFAYLGSGVADSAKTFFRIPQFIIENALIGLILLGSWGMFVLNKEYKYKFHIKTFLLDFLYAFLVIFATCILIAPHNTALALFGPLKQQAMDFTVSHRILIYACFVIPFVGMFVFRNKSYELRHFVCLLIALTVFYGYFEEYSFNTYIHVFECIRSGEKSNDLNSLPLHLCNTAVIIMLIAFIFKNKPCFYFNYLINILGASFAVLMPDTEGDVLYALSIHFWENHLWVIALPFLARGLDLFPRPKLKYVLYAVMTFSIYYVVVCTFDAWFGYNDQLEQGANYFFLNSAKYAEKVNGYKLREYIWNINGHKIYWLYWLLIYVVYVALIFLVWFAFSFGYQISDKHYDIMVRNKRKRQEIKEMKNRQNERREGEEDMIKIEHLTKIYDKDDHAAVDDFSLTVNPGDIFGFLGHNGAGKSTLIKCLIGVQTITSGSIEIFGHNISTEPLETKKLIGYVPDNHATYEGLTGREYINYIANLYLVTTEERKERLAKYAELFKISGALDKPIKSYSHGMKQKITIIASLIHEPKVWVLDEPLTGLDPTSCYQIKECMREHAKKGNIVFFSSHVIDVVENVCNRIAVISHGELIFTDSLENISKQNKSLEDIYLEYVTNAESR